MPLNPRCGSLKINGLILFQHLNAKQLYLLENQKHYLFCYSCYNKEVPKIPENVKRHNFPFSWLTSLLVESTGGTDYIPHKFS